jgi:predicted metalloprotease with PDZ domain
VAILAASKLHTMRQLLLILFLAPYFCFGQTFNEYEISFENAVHHEASITAVFKDLKSGVLEVRMSRSSPGRYAIHEFAKNVYNVKAVNSKGQPLKITRPDPYQWNVSGHDGVVKFTYTLFGDRGDGTYLQIDETHAHLNMPATFAFARGLDDRPVKVKFNIREDLKWKVATQLKPEGGTTFSAPNLQYFMDSPAEISNFFLREFEEESNGKKYIIRAAVHHPGSEAVLETYMDGVKKIVKQQKAIMGGLANYDFGTYTFLACYMPQASGDGMEHRNSTYVISSRSLEGEGGMNVLGTVSHEFFHSWNVERIRPASLEPFNFERANMSAELWFAEGFTNYLGDLAFCRAGLMTQKQYAEGLSGTINFVMNSSGRNYFNPMEMSQQAPFADASTFIDPTNMRNTYVSYYAYGEVLGIALDLSLRNLNGSYNLDDYMKLVWNKHGKTEKPYTTLDLKAVLADYITPAFANEFFDRYILNRELPDYEKLLAGMGVSYKIANPEKGYMGGNLRKGNSGLVISSYTKPGSPVYKAGLESGDIILSIDGKSVSDVEGVDAILSPLKPGKEIAIIYKRLNQERSCKVVLGENPDVQTMFFEDAGLSPTPEMLKRRASWLDAK